MLRLRSIRLLAATAFASATLFTGVATTSAQPKQNGLVNVNIGDVTILENVGIGVAAQVAANICGVPVNVAALVAAIRTDDTETVCEITQGNQEVPVTIERD